MSGVEIMSFFFRIKKSEYHGQNDVKKLKDMLIETTDYEKFTNNNDFIMRILEIVMKMKLIFDKWYNKRRRSWLTSKSFNSLKKLVSIGNRHINFEDKDVNKDKINSGLLKRFSICLNDWDNQLSTVKISSSKSCLNSKNVKILRNIISRLKTIDFKSENINKKSRKIHRKVTTEEYELKLLIDDINESCLKNDNYSLEKFPNVLYWTITNITMLEKIMLNINELFKRWSYREKNEWIPGNSREVLGKLIETGDELTYLDVPLDPKEILYKVIGDSSYSENLEPSEIMSKIKDNLYLKNYAKSFESFKNCLREWYAILTEINVKTKEKKKYYSSTLDKFLNTMKSLRKTMILYSGNLDDLGINFKRTNSFGSSNDLPNETSKNDDTNSSENSISSSILSNETSYETNKKDENSDENSNDDNEDNQTADGSDHDNNEYEILISKLEEASSDMSVPKGNLSDDLVTKYLENIHKILLNLKSNIKLWYDSHTSDDLSKNFLSKILKKPELNLFDSSKIYEAYNDCNKFISEWKDFVENKLRSNEDCSREVLSKFESFLLMAKSMVDIIGKSDLIKSEGNKALEKALGTAGIPIMMEFPFKNKKKKNK